MNVRELMQQRAALIGQARAMIDKAEQEQREFSEEETTAYDGLLKQVETLAGQIGRREALESSEAELAKLEPRRSSADPGAGMPAANAASAPNGDEARAIARYVRSGRDDWLRELRASNDTDMNITTSADGGYAVPTGHFRGIIAKRNELSLVGPLGLTRIPGVGTTVNVPIDNGTANVFVSTNEAVAVDRDAPVLGQQAMTLVKYTKKVQLSDELLQDEDSNLVAFLNDYVGRAAARTYNDLLCDEVVASGTSVALGAAAAVSAGDPETLVYALKGEYGDGAAFVMARATEGALRKLTGNAFLYQPTPQGVPLRTLSGFPIHNSEFVPAIGAGNKSILFGNFAYVGYREGPGMTFLRDPFGAANTGQVNLYYYFRLDIEVLVAEAVLYGTHPTA